MVTATYDSGDVKVTFTARMVRNDYGVDRSPVWHEPEDITIETVEICGVDVDVTKLPTDLADAITELADNLDFEE